MQVMWNDKWLFPNFWQKRDNNKREKQQTGRWTSTMEIDFIEGKKKEWCGRKDDQSTKVFFKKFCSVSYLAFFLAINLKTSKRGGIQHFPLHVKFFEITPPS